ncbi:Rossmann-like and DUF2520 domain-containing protein [Luteirhabdus pelagi]|uniref:Rossmann-like and DUF2520 domain-containing protein n=1 Tax=Luteirhabdus pelagi TaxID=2792783 RepID=UPI00193A0BD7|nr:DUF2520 domain-containing protein [Luteirhabdus pelagi]
MISVVFIGYGNVNYHISNALYEAHQVHVKQVISQNNKTLSPTLGDVSFTTDFQKVEEADLYIIAVPDDAIEDVSNRLGARKGLVVHTSGSVSMKALNTHERYGVFYPLQTFSKNRKVSFQDIPICIEANSNSDVALLRTLATSISNNVTEVSSEERATLHLAAVFVNNFTNYLYAVSEDILKAKDLDFSLLKPLLQETAEKVQSLSPKEAQTGPAKRKDLKTMQNHVHLLQQLGKEPLIELYKKLSEGIQQNQTNENS